MAECVICGRERPTGGVPVGRSHTGSLVRVFACAGGCSARAYVACEVVAIPVEALTAGGAALLAVLDRDRVGGDLNRVDPDELVAAVVTAVAPLVAAAELRRITAQTDTTGGALSAYRARELWARCLRARADELDPAGGAR